jgi:hypothetical protein
MSSQIEFCDPLWGRTTVVVIGAETLRKAEKQIVSCEACTPDAADVLFDSVLDQLTGCDPKTTEYEMPDHAVCPRCCAALKSGHCRWRTSKRGRKLLIQPGTLVSLKQG